jgi:hypothetical protein
MSNYTHLATIKVAFASPSDEAAASTLQHLADLMQSNASTRQIRASVVASSVDASTEFNAEPTTEVSPRTPYPISTPPTDSASYATSAKV